MKKLAILSVSFAFRSYIIEYWSQNWKSLGLFPAFWPFVHCYHQPWCQASKLSNVIMKNHSQVEILEVVNAQDSGLATSRFAIADNIAPMLLENKKHFCFQIYFQTCRIVCTKRLLAAYKHALKADMKQTFDSCAYLLLRWHALKEGSKPSKAEGSNHFPISWGDGDLFSSLDLWKRAILLLLTPYNPSLSIMYTNVIQ